MEFDFDFDDPIFSLDGGDPLLSWDVPQDFFSNSFSNSNFNPDIADENFMGDVGNGAPGNFETDFSGGVSNPISATELDSFASGSRIPYMNNSGGSMIDQATSGLGKFANAAGEFMTKNKLWAPALGMGAGIIDRYAQGKMSQEMRDELIRRKRGGFVSGQGLSLWRQPANKQG